MATAITPADRAAFRILLIALPIASIIAAALAAIVAGALSGLPA